MASRVRSSRRRKAIAARRRFLAGTVLAALAIGSAAAVLSQREPSSVGVEFEASPIAAVEPPPPAGPLDASATYPQRAVFPYSVVPGGVESVEELRNAITTDAVVADHYKGFDLSKARVERLSVPRAAHVSYRLGEHVYWTRKALVLPAGERVITDGKNVARTRCGNQVAADVPGATSPAEPAAAVLDTPLASRPVSSVAGLPTAFPSSTVTRPLSGMTGDGGTGRTPLGGGAGPTPGHPLEATSVEPCVPSAPCKPDAPPGAGPGEGPGTPGNGVVPPPGSTGPGTPDNRVVPPPSGSTGPGGPDNAFVPPPVLHPPFVPPGVTIPPLVTDGPLWPPNPSSGDSPHGPGTPPGESFVPPGGDGPQVPGAPTGGPYVPPVDGPPVDGPPGGGTDLVPPQQDVPATIPEPGPIMLMLTGAAGFLARRFSARRRG